MPIVVVLTAGGKNGKRTGMKYDIAVNDAAENQKKVNPEYEYFQQEIQQPALVSERPEGS
ncbi:hypothetical protein GCM10011361_09480 [Muriicola marianensis]|uniref:Uncharacterized protein n=1 Tax=Muriicola marianensis TaxID=1324801 RepID=A0ABQ1QUK0_9FLAO|nr:hypothetical protein GCM10011361_09480 [Muriicola marianensis]